MRMFGANQYNCIYKRLLSLWAGMLCCVLFVAAPMRAYAAEQHVTIDALKKLALSRSEQFEYDVYSQVTDAYVELYVLEHKITMLSERYDRLQNEVKELRKKQITGEIGAEEKKKSEALFNENKRQLAELQRHRDSALENLKSLTGLELTESIILDNPYVEMSLDREKLEKLLLYQKRVVTDGADEQNADMLKQTYEDFISARNLYDDLKEQAKLQKKELEELRKKKISGQLTDGVYEGQLLAYEDNVLARWDAYLQLCSSLYKLDNLSYGGLLDGENTAYDGTIEQMKGTYYINSISNQQIFEFGLLFSTDVSSQLTDYELWVDGVRIGERTKLADSVSDLSLKLQGAEQVFVRLYNGDDFVSDCLVEATKDSGEITVQLLKPVEKEDNLLGSYILESETITGMCNLWIEAEPGLEIAYYAIKLSNGEYLVNNKKRPIREAFHYLALARGNMEELTICFYDESETLIYEGSFDTTSHTVCKKEK